MGIEGYLVSSALIGVVAQRLVRRICTYCKETYEPPPHEMTLWKEHKLDKHVFHRGRGCGYCARTGYRGRIGVFEVLPITDEIKRLISERAPAREIREMALREGMTPLRAAGVEKVAEDQTTLSEVMRCVWIN
jgi:type IV pilus assembly protein PilB